MPFNVNQTYNQAFRLIEQWRYRYSITRALPVFIKYWAHLHSGLYAPADEMINESKFTEVAMPLTHLLQQLMMHGETDPLARLLTEFCQGDSKHLAFFPTPSEVSHLIHALTNGGRDIPVANRIYEPACGTAGISLESIEKLYFDNHNLDRPLGQISLVVEDIAETAIHSYFIQLLHKLQYLERVGQKSSVLKSVTISQVDVISRKAGSVHYVLEAP